MRTVVIHAPEWQFSDSLLILHSPLCLILPWLRARLNHQVDICQLGS